MHDVIMTIQHVAVSVFLVKVFVQAYILEAENLFLSLVVYGPDRWEAEIDKVAMVGKICVTDLID